MAEKKHHVLKCEPGHIGLIQKTRLPLNCGRCNGRAYAVIVEPEGQMARAVGVECMGCGNGWFIDDQGYVQTSGEITMKHGDGNGSLQ